MKRAARYPWWLEPASFLAAWLLRALAATWRVERDGVPDQAARSLGGAGCIYALWHARLLPLVWTHRGRGIAVLVSRHRDGQLITRIIERMGFVTGRGSSTRGGEEGVREMLAWAGRGRDLAVTPDGPRGPAERMKPGLAALAGWTALPVVPIASSASDSWVMRSWDRFRVPRPFARVVVVCGAPLTVPRDLDAAGAEAWGARLEEALAAVTREAARRSGEGA